MEWEEEEKQERRRHRRYGARKLLASVVVGGAGAYLALIGHTINDRHEVTQIDKAIDTMLPKAANASHIFAIEQAGISLSSFMRENGTTLDCPALGPEVTAYLNRHSTFDDITESDYKTFSANMTKVLQTTPTIISGQTTEESLCGPQANLPASAWSEYQSLDATLANTVGANTAAEGLYPITREDAYAAVQLGDYNNSKSFQEVETFLTEIAGGALLAGCVYIMYQGIDSIVSRPK
jgi:hypothetical protein